jgi:hypothetical protein
VILSGNAVMPRVAEEMWEHLSRETKIVSHERRRQRLVANDRIEVEACWKELLQKVLPFWEKKPLMPMLDLTPYTQEATIVYSHGMRNELIAATSVQRKERSLMRR